LTVALFSLCGFLAVDSERSSPCRVTSSAFGKLDGNESAGFQLFPGSPEAAGAADRASMVCGAGPTACATVTLAALRSVAFFLAYRPSFAPGRNSPWCSYSLTCTAASGLRQS